MDRSWLVDMFLEAGLADDDARKVADACLVRLIVQRQRPKSPETSRPSLVDHIVRDPLVSIARIAGNGEEGLPFVDAETGRLSSKILGYTMAKTEMDPEVANAYAQVVAEAYEPKDLFQPVWEALGHSGPVDLEVLRHEDWGALREHFPDLLGRQSLDQPATVLVRATPSKA